MDMHEQKQILWEHKFGIGHVFSSIIVLLFLAFIISELYKGLVHHDISSIIFFSVATAFAV